MLFAAVTVRSALVACTRRGRSRAIYDVACFMRYYHYSDLVVLMHFACCGLEDDMLVLRVVWRLIEFAVL